MCAFLALTIIDLAISHFYHKIGQISATLPILSVIWLYLLLAVVEITTDVLSALLGCPMALVFDSLALVIHVLIAFFIGTWLGSNVVGQLGIRTRAAFGNKVPYQWLYTSWEKP